jgi:hypothetical protein
MKTTSKRLLFWTPRVLCLLFAAFISLFALDVFNETHGLWQTALALTMHLAPTFVILAVLALSWRWEWVGGLLFVALGIFYIIAFRGRFPWSVYAVIAGPLFAVGLLFLLNWRYRAELHAKS